eukprot:TRINITY_DN7259_c0_g2_i1.p1 TRINITY_DN7259_c0_g2~~TRINITY_DN7259_c0_g2_i1.p1  ORF type:complete len:176 (+),score=46.21 TRINITY_DN7259_c0_g2_i1:94-621(+)
MQRCIRSAAAVRCGLRRCSTVSRSVNIGGATITYQGPAKPFQAMTEEDFYRHEDFHSFFTELGLEVYLPERKADADAKAEKPAPAQPTEPPPSSEPNLPMIHPGMEGLEIQCGAHEPMWMVKKEIEKKKGIPDSQFDLYHFNILLEDHKTLLDYKETAALAGRGEHVALTVRRKP